MSGISVQGLEPPDLGLKLGQPALELEQRFCDLRLGNAIVLPVLRRRADSLVDPGRPGTRRAVVDATGTSRGLPVALDLLEGAYVT